MPFNLVKKSFDIQGYVQEFSHFHLDHQGSTKNYLIQRHLKLTKACEQVMIHKLKVIAHV